MKRPLALIGLTSMLVLAVCFYVSASWALVILVFSAVGLAVSLIVKRLRRRPEFPAFFAVVMVSVIGFNLFSCYYVKPVQNEFAGKKSEVTAILLDEPECYRGKEFYTVRTNTINGKEAKHKLLLGTKNHIDCEVGDTLKFTAELEASDYGKYLADRVYLRTFIYGYVEVDKAENKPIYFNFVKLRETVREALYTELNLETADLASAVLLGDSNFSDESYEVLRRAGLTHIVVVSGLHLSIITLLYNSFLGKWIKNKFINALCAGFLVLFFLCLTGFGKSSIRAAIMLFVLILSKIFQREGDSLNSLGFAAIILCINPFVVGDIGVLLSFSATFGIVVFSTPLYEFMTQKLKPVKESYHKGLNKTLRYIATLFATTVSAVICTLPVNIMFFGKVSLVQIFANLIVAPLVQWFMLLSALSAVFHFIPIPFATEIIAFATDILGGFMLWVAKLFASLPMAYVKADYNFVVFWIFAVIFLFLVAYFIRRNGKGLRLICVCLSLCIFAAGFSGHIISSNKKVTVYVTPSKYGQSVVLSSKDGNVLIYSADDPYNEYYTRQVLEDIYTEKQLMILTNKNLDESYASLFDYDDFLMYHINSKDDCEVLVWDKVLIKLFERKGEIYTFISYADTSVLILPDFGDAALIPSELRKTDFLISSGIIDNMELLGFDTLISNGNDFRALATVDYFRTREINATIVSDVVNFDIVG